MRASSSGRRIPAPNFAYEPINHGRVNLATFHLEDMQITVKFNLVHVNGPFLPPKLHCFSTKDDVASISLRYSHLF